MRPSLGLSVTAQLCPLPHLTGCKGTAHMNKRGRDSQRTSYDRPHLSYQTSTVAKGNSFQDPAFSLMYVRISK